MTHAHHTHTHTHDHTCNEGKLLLKRRSALFGLGAAMSLGSVRFAHAATGGAGAPRLVVLNLLGGLDGLSMVAPYGDANLAKLRGQIMAPAVGKTGGMFDLGGFYGLHPAMPNLHAMFAAGQASMVHAVGNAAATRSHFEGQDYLQSGAPTLLSSGWLNRAMGLVAGNGTMQSGLAMGTAPSLLTQGGTVAAGWAPNPFPMVNTQTVKDLQNLLSPDPLLGPAFQAAFQDNGMFTAALAASPMPGGLTTLQQSAWAAGSFLASPNGPRIAAIQAPGYDTHDNQITRLNGGLADLDGALQILKTQLGAAWSNTVVMTMTEFGRMAACNGTATCGGTDHGTAFAVVLAGGAVQGGQVLGTWPGLAASQLYQGRDLAPTTDIRSIGMGVLGQHMGLSASALATVFPGATVQAMNGLVS
jgi:uncharacterized protein (DUF1501 family)